MHAPNGLRAVLFDLDNTLRYTRPSGEESFGRFLAELCYPLTPAAQRQGERWTHAYWAESAKQGADRERFPEGGPEFWRNYLCRHLIGCGFENRPVRARAGRG